MTRAIYEPKGRAAEYAELALNLYDGCTHGCRYCYVPACLHRKPEEFFASAAPRKDILAALEKDLARRRDWIGDRRVLLCFSCDPYQRAERRHHVTRAALEMLVAAGVKVSVLTKNPYLALRDSALMKTGDVELGTTVVTDDPFLVRKWEPHAPWPAERLAALHVAHRRGIRTWISLEPVIVPRDALVIVERAHEYVDFWRVGKINYHRVLEQAVDWAGFLGELRETFARFGCRYMIKSGLLKAGEGGG